MTPTPILYELGAEHWLELAYLALLEETLPSTTSTIAMWCS